MTVSAPLLTNRALNRALLARQMLLERAECSVPEALTRLFGMQAQAPFAPYFGLWARLQAFDPHELGALLESRGAVRMALLRDTVHLVTAEDALLQRGLLADFLERRLLVGSAYAKQIAKVDAQAVAAAGRALVEAEPRTISELAAMLSEQWPDADGQAMAMVVRNLVPLVQVPPRAVWGKSGVARCTSLETWLGTPVPENVSLDELVRRYLAVYGPATIMDAQAWSGLTKLNAVFDRLRPELVTFTDEQGRELFDLPGAPLPDAETPAPIRFFPEYDNLLLSHADRTRVIPLEHRKIMWSANGVVPGGILIDGFADGLWKIRKTKREQTLAIQMLVPVTDNQRREIEEEGYRLLAFASGGTTSDAVIFES